VQLKLEFVQGVFALSSTSCSKVETAHLYRPSFCHIGPCTVYKANDCDALRELRQQYRVLHNLHYMQSHGKNRLRPGLRPNPAAWKIKTLFRSPGQLGNWIHRPHSLPSTHSASWSWAHLRRRRRERKGG